MDAKKIFEMALSITKPWFINDIKFDHEKKKLDIFIDFKRGSVFSSIKEDYNEMYKAYDTVDKTWRHMNFFEHECYISCRTPRIDLGDNQTELISPPWAGMNSGFTLLFEALIIQLCTSMTVHSVSKIINENDNKIWRLLEKYIDISREEEDYSDISVIGMDETSRAKGHEYVTLFVDLKKKKTIFVTEGKGHETINEFSKDLEIHKGSADNIEDVSCDMSPAFIKGVKENLPNAKITFDKFHIIKLINKAVDKVRREEAITQSILKFSRYALLKNESNRTVRQNEIIEKLKLSKLNLKSLRAMNIRETFQDIYKSPTMEMFTLLLKKWYFWATHSRLEPIKKVAKTIKSHWDGIIVWKQSQINNGILEGFNSVIQATKAKARGFKTFKNFKIMIYLTTGKLNFNVVNPYVNI
jgi:transposase